MGNLSKLVERGAGELSPGFRASEVLLVSLFNRLRCEWLLGLSLNQENQMKELRQAKEELQRQVEELNATTDVLHSQLKEQVKSRHTDP